MRTLRLLERYVRAYPTQQMPEVIDDELLIDSEQTAFVCYHCWNIGFPEGPAVPPDYWVFMGSMPNHRLCVNVVTTKIKPALEASR